MTLTVELQPVPLSTDVDGVVRVGGTRVTLDTVVEAFDEGASAEEIVQQYPSLALADVYAAISYYLRFHDAVQAYLQQRQEEAAVVRRHNEGRFDMRGIRQRLLARREDGPQAA